MKNKSFKMLTSVTIVLIIVFAAKFLFFPGKSKAEGGAGRPKMELRINGLIVKQQFLSDTLILAGSVLPQESTDLSFESPGKIVAILFEEGSFVKKGTKLAKLNDADLQAELQKAFAAKKLAELKEERAKSLVKKDGISKEELDQAENAAEQARAQVAMLQADIAKTEIVAPYDGVIGLRKFSTGQYVAAGAVIASISKAQQVKVEGALPEAYFGMLRKGELIHFLPANAQQPIAAKVYAVEPKIDEMSRTSMFRAVAENSKGTIPAGGFAKIFVKLDRKMQGYIIPAEALVPDAKGYIVYVFSSGKVKETRVTLLKRDAENSYISEGLSDGDTLAVSAIINMRNNLPVKYGIISRQ